MTGLVASITAPVLVMAPAVNAAASTVVVTGNTTSTENDPGRWWFNRDASTATPYEFNTDAHSLGQGSLYVKPIGANPADKFIGENYVMQPMGDVTSVSFDFQLGSGVLASKANQFYMNVYANFGSSSPTKYYDCRYDVVATTGSDSSFTTVTFDPTQSYPVTTRGGGSPSPHTCPSAPAGMDTIDPGSTLRAVAVTVGDTSINDQGVSGYLDNVVVTTTANQVTYDFEPILSPSDKDACKNGGWTTFNSPAFKNQGDCVSSVASKGKAKGNPLQTIVSFFTNMF